MTSGGCHTRRRSIGCWVHEIIRRIADGSTTLSHCGIPITQVKMNLRVTVLGRARRIETISREIDVFACANILEIIVLRGRVETDVPSSFVVIDGIGMTVVVFPLE